MKSRSTGLAALLLFTVLTVMMTWPQARYLGTHVVDADDPLLSTWRISWIAHVLPTSPLELMNGNMRTLAYTDAVLIQGLAAAPLLWSGVPPIATYNLLLLASVAVSGWTMFLYARHLTGSASSAVLAGMVFAFVPFRFDHLHHLELQATMFLPLALLWADRALETGSRRDVWLAIAALVAQVYCGIYYAVFLVTALLVFIPFRWRSVPAPWRAGLMRAGLSASLVAVLIVVPYLSIYLLNRSSLGDRTSADILTYSATLANYLSTPYGNLVHGDWSGPLGQNERRLFPGFVALAIAVAGFAGLERRRLTLIVTGLIGFIISLGLNTPIYAAIGKVLFIYHGLRAPARASILVFLALAGLVAYGWSRLEPLFKRWAPVATMVAAVALLGEYVTVQSHWYVPGPSPEVSRWLARQPRAVVLELPLTTSDRLDLVPDGVYMFRSIEHWQPILNGYSGFFPASYLELTERMRTFPDEASIAYLKQRQVDLVVIHGGLFTPDNFGRITSVLLGRSDFEVKAQFEEPRGPDMVFRLLR